MFSTHTHTHTHTQIAMKMPLNLQTSTLGARGFLREEPRSAISEARSGEERENTRSEKASGCPRQLIDLTAPIDLN